MQNRPVDFVMKQTEGRVPISDANSFSLPVDAALTHGKRGKDIRHYNHCSLLWQCVS
jgi:hypothetical protein